MFNLRDAHVPGLSKTCPCQMGDIKLDTLFLKYAYSFLYHEFHTLFIFSGVQASMARNVVVIDMRKLN